MQQKAVGHFRKKQVRDQQLIREMNEQRKGIVGEQSAHIDEWFFEANLVRDERDFVSRC